MDAEALKVLHVTWKQAKYAYETEKLATVQINITVHRSTKTKLVSFFTEMG